MKKVLWVLTFIIGFSIFMPNVMAASSDPQFCIRTSEMWQFLGYGLIVIKILIPLGIIALGIIDFSKAIVLNDEKAINKAAVTLAKRFIVGVAVFFVPTIISVLFDLLENFTGSLDAIEACETCLLNPLDTECENSISQAETWRKNGE